MSDRYQSEHPNVGMALGDILYVIFRHKWKIALISVAGIAATAVLPLVRPVPYKSEATLLIKYVLETKAPGQLAANESGIKPVDVGEGVINTELEILTSLDLAQQVADAIGPEKLLAKVGGGNNRLQAAGLIKKHLLAEPSKRGNVIRIAFQHPDREIVQPVLEQVVQTYKKKHNELYVDVRTFDEYLKQQTEDYGIRLKQTEEELKAAIKKAGVIDIEDSKKYYSEQLASLSREINDAKVKLAERQAMVNAMGKVLNTTPGTATNTASIPAQKSAEYKEVCGLLDSLRKKEQELRLQFTPESTPVKDNRERIAAIEKLKQQLETENPDLLALKATGIGTADPATGARIDFFTEMISISALETKIRKLAEQLDEVRKQATVVSEAEGPILELKKRKEQETERYRIDSEQLEQTRIMALSAGKLWNIGVIQSPSPPFPAASKLYKIMGIVLFGSLAAAFALAFFIDHYLDRSLKRPQEVESKLGLPLFISIPKIGLNGKSRDVGIGRRLLSQEAGAAEDANDQPNEAWEDSNGQMRHTVHNTELTPWDPRHKLRPFYEGLRDRLITYFEIKNVTRKPKLVAVTSCAEGSGVSTIAAGLAASLSETEGGKVLLVDMNLKNGAAHYFYKGDLACGLDDALEVEKRDNALVQDQLYVVTEGASDNRLPRILPKRFDHLVPKLHASDYDYIIFDMPQVSQVSVTPRLARFMDMVLMVVESEKTDHDVIQRASNLLAESKANVSVILNKEQAYVPKWLQQGH